MHVYKIKITIDQNMKLKGDGGRSHLGGTCWHAGLLVVLMKLRSVY